MRVNEIFQTIQGEGPGSGRRAVFVRFSGCNRFCLWCDSKYALHLYMELSVVQVVEAIQRTNCRYVVLSGGEPMMQPEFNLLLAALTGYDVDIETNGTIGPTLDSMNGMTGGIRYIVSPKDPEVVPKWDQLKVHHVFKMVVTEENYLAVIQTCKDNVLSGVWFMPQTDITSTYGQQLHQMVRMGRLITEAMNNLQYEGYLCTRLQNLYRVR